MPEIPFVGGCYLTRSKNLNSQACQNLYPVIDKWGGKSIIALYPLPGLKEWMNLSSFVSRGNNLTFSGTVNARIISAISAEYEIYWELLNRSVSQPSWTGYSYLLAAESFVTVDPSAYDGNLTWEFEVVGFNDNAFDVKVQAVDSSLTVCAEVTLAAGGAGPTGSELFRSRVPFTPTGASIYGLRVQLVGATKIEFYPLDCMITTARIVVTQSNPSKTRLQIPMMADANTVVLQEYSSFPYDYPIGREVYNYVPSELNDYTSLWGRFSVSDPYDSNYFTTKWRFSASELSAVSKATFSVAAKGYLPNPYSNVTTITATVAITRFHLLIYTAPSGSPTGACMTGVPSNYIDASTVHVDTCTGTTFSPIPSTLGYWETSPYPYNFIIYPNLGVLTGATYNIHVGGEINDGVWGHFARWFQITVPADMIVTNASLRFQSLAGNQLRMTLTYDLDFITPPTLNVALRNITDGTIVSNSEMAWNQGEAFNRKNTDISLSDLKDGCEYELVVKNSGYTYDLMNDYEIMDAQLWLNITPINNLAIWYRCVHAFDDNFDNYVLPANWACISSRVLFKLPLATSEVYFETTGYYRYTAFGDGTIILKDMGTGDSSGAGGNSVTDGTLIWQAGEVGTRTRKRTAALTLTDGNRYANQQDFAGYDALNCNNGFIIVIVK